MREENTEDLVEWGHTTQNDWWGLRLMKIESPEDELRLTHLAFAALLYFTKKNPTILHCEQ